MTTRPRADRRDRLRQPSAPAAPARTTPRLPRTNTNIRCPSGAHPRNGAHPAPQRTTPPRFMVTDHEALNPEATAAHDHRLRQPPQPGVRRPTATLADRPIIPPAQHPGWGLVDVSRRSGTWRDRQPMPADSSSITVLNPTIRTGARPRVAGPAERSLGSVLAQHFCHAKTEVLKGILLPPLMIFAERVQGFEAIADASVVTKLKQLLPSEYRPRSNDQPRIFSDLSSYMRSRTASSCCLRLTSRIASSSGLFDLISREARTSLGNLRVRTAPRAHRTAVGARSSILCRTYCIKESALKCLQEHSPAGWNIGAPRTGTWPTGFHSVTMKASQGRARPASYPTPTLPPVVQAIFRMRTEPSSTTDSGTIARRPVFPALAHS